MATLKPLSVEDIVTGVFTGKTVSGVQWLPDGSAFTFLKRNPKTKSLDVYRHNVATGDETVVLEGSTLQYNGKTVPMSAYATTGGQNHLLITGDQTPIWRWSYSASYYLYDIEKKDMKALANADPLLQNVSLSSDNSKVAFVKSSNIYVADTQSGEVKQLTFDGNDNILNGIFDWVYEEEFHKPEAFRWSPDSKKIAFWRTDQTHVKSFTLMDETKAYTETSSLKYPKVGEKNSIVKIGVVDVTSGEIKWMDIGTNDDIYIPRIDWTSIPGKLAIQRLNRKQNFLELLLADTTTGTTKCVLTDENKNGWIDITDDYIFFKNKEQFLWSSERSGFRHIYLSELSGKQLAQITSGDWEVSEIIGFDEANGVVYFYAKKDGAINQCIYRTDLDGKIELISPASGWHRGIFAPNWKHYVNYSSTTAHPEKVSLKQCDGKLVTMLEENDFPALHEYTLTYPEHFTLETSEGLKFNSYIIKPPNFDPAKKYPVLVYNYSGPAVQLVVNKWLLSRGLWHSYLAQLGCIVFCMDHRGMSGRGRAFKDYAYGDLSKFAVIDQIEGVKWLRKQPFVDEKRIACWGWSGGGYLTCMLMMRAAEYFCAGVSIAPVSDFRNYDTIWTERYMGLLSENLMGYKAADVLTYVDGLKSPLLLVHGTGDDNVHPQNTIMLVDKLIAAGKQFELMLYPNKNHGIPGQASQRHLYTMMTNFIRRYLNI